MHTSFHLGDDWFEKTVDKRLSREIAATMTGVCRYQVEDGCEMMWVTSNYHKSERKIVKRSGIAMFFTFPAHTVSATLYHDRAPAPRPTPNAGAAAIPVPTRRDRPARCG